MGNPNLTGREFMDLVQSRLDGRDFPVALTESNMKRIRSQCNNRQRRMMLSIRRRRLRRDLCLDPETSLLDAFFPVADVPSSSPIDTIDIESMSNTIRALRDEVFHLKKRCASLMAVRSRDRSRAESQMAQLRVRAQTASRAAKRAQRASRSKSVELKQLKRQIFLLLHAVRKLAMATSKEQKVAALQRLEVMMVRTCRYRL
ncbi:Uncharacterized protein PBTT_05208 [Plasmodiophora brassicae]